MAHPLLAQPEVAETAPGAAGIEVRPVFRRTLTQVGRDFPGRAQLVSLIAAIPDAVVVVDGEGVVRFVNPAGVELFRRSEVDLIGERLGFAVERNRVAEIEILAGGSPRRAQLRVVDTIWDGRPALLAMMRDVSVQHELERRLENERALGERRLRDALNASSSAILVADRSQHILLANVAACTLFDFDQAALIQAPLSRILPEAAVLTAIDAGPLPRSLRQTARRADGSILPVEIGLTHFRDGNGGVVMLTIADVTTLVEQEQSLRERNEQLNRLNEELSQFAYSASHDLKAPLLTVAGLLDLGIEDLDSGDLGACRQNLRDALETCQRNARKLEAVLAIARAGHDLFSVEEIGLPGEIAQIWHDLTAALPSPPELRLEIGDGVFKTERQTLLTILENLISNSVRFRRPEGAWVWVAAWADADVLVIEVADNGIGIPVAQQHRVFEMFSRFSEASGSGLGLALVRKHLDRLKGNVSFDSGAGGSRFRLTLPHR